MPPLRILSRSHREALPDGRENRRSAHLLLAAFGRRRQKNPPRRWLARHLDPAPPPLHPPRALDEISPRFRSVRGELLPHAAGVKIGMNFNGFQSLATRRRRSTSFQFPPHHACDAAQAASHHGERPWLWC